jgi:hypothetical protein
LAALLRALGVRNRTEAAFKAGKLVNATGLPSPLDSMGAPQNDRRDDERPLRARSTGQD